MLIFLDLDGTVIGSHGVSDAVWPAAKAARERGATLVVCTGRARAGLARRIAGRLGPDNPHIFESGALIAQAKGEVYRADELELDDVMRLVRRAETAEAVLELYTSDGIFVSKFNEDCAAHARALDITVIEADLEAVANSRKIIRAHWIMRPETVDQALDVDLGKSHIAVASSPLLPKNVFASITHRDVSKGSAARFVADRLGEPLEDAVAIGDSVGDESVLETVGHPYVMGDADQELLQRYEAVGTVDEDGVVELLEVVTTTDGRRATPRDL